MSTKPLDEARDVLDEADDAVSGFTAGGKSLPPPWNLLVMILHVLRLILDFIDRKSAAIVPPAPPQAASQAATAATSDPKVKAEQAQAQAIDAASRGKVARAAPDDATPDNDTDS